MFNGRLYAFLFLFFFKFSFCFVLCGEGLPYKIQEIINRSSNHEQRIAKLLSKPPIKPNDYPLKVAQFPDPNRSPKVPVAEVPPYLPIPQFDPESESSQIPNNDNNLTKDEFHIDAAYTDEKEGVPDDFYDELSQEPLELRGVGYYFSPILGLVSPNDSAVRDGVSANSYTADTGLLLGLNYGKDFGAIKVEAEYSYFGGEGVAQTVGDISLNVNSLFSRIIFEKEIGDRIDLRAGLGMGFGFVSIDGNVIEANDVGFAYDFLFGFCYNVSENLGWNLDYKYYLSAANDEYDRIAAHCLMLSAKFML